VNVGVGVTVGEGVGLGAGVGLGVGMGMGVTIGEGVAVGVGVGSAWQAASKNVPNTTGASQCQDVRILTTFFMTRPPNTWRPRPSRFHCGSGTSRRRCPPTTLTLHFILPMG